MRSKPNASQWIGRSSSDTTLVTATARIGVMRQSRSSVPNVANISPAVTKERSPIRPCAPMVAIASPPITASPATMTAAPAARRAGSFSLQHQGGEHEPAERRAGRLDHAAMAERHEQEARIAEHREQRPAERASAAPPLAQPTPPRSARPSRATSGRNTSPAQTKR